MRKSRAAGLFEYIRVSLDSEVIQSSLVGEIIQNLDANRPIDEMSIANIHVYVGFLANVSEFECLFDFTSFSFHAFFFSIKRLARKFILLWNIKTIYSFLSKSLRLTTL